MTAATADPTTEDVVTPTEPIGEPDTGTALEPEMTMKERQARMGRLIAFEALFKKFVADERAVMFEEFMAARAETGSKSFSHTFGPKQSIGFTLKDAEAKFVVGNEAELVDWLLDNHPEETETKTVPRDAYVKVLLSKVEVSTDEDGNHTVFDPATGEPIPGLRYMPASDPTSFTARWTGGDAAKEAALAEVFELGLPNLLGLPTGGDQ